MLDMALVPELPVFSAGDGTWQANAQQATLPAVAVQGVTVVDELAQAAVKPVLPVPDREMREQEHLEQEAQARRPQSATKQQRTGADHAAAY